MNDIEEQLAVSILQIKAEPFCTECGACCLVVLDDMRETVDEENGSNIWTACTMCGSEMAWAATPNHLEMLRRIVDMTIQEQGNVIEKYENIRDENGKCIGLCGGICKEHWKRNEK